METNVIQHQDLSKLVYQRLKKMIITEELKPGMKILQEKIAADLGVSRMPLHKAFQMLEADFLVESIPRKGIYVRQINMTDIFDAFECREAIEGMAIRRTAQNISKNQAAELRNLFLPFKNHLDDVDLHAYQEADHTFHNLIIKISGNKILARMEMVNSILAHTYQRGLIRLPAITYFEHMDIIDALDAKNSDMAEYLIRQHFQLSRAEIVQVANSR